VDFLTDSLATGLAFLFGGASALLASLPERYKVLEWLSSFLFTLFIGAPLAGLDVSVPWSPFLEVCLTAGVLMLVAAIVRYGQKELAEGEYD
jgi:hypothetical protein